MDQIFPELKRRQTGQARGDGKLPVTADDDQDRSRPRGPDGRPLKGAVDQRRDNANKPGDCPPM
jgi:hypothetical protein